MNRRLLFFLAFALVSAAVFTAFGVRMESRRTQLLITQARVIENDVHERLRLYLSGTMGARIVASAFWEQEAVNDSEYQKLAATLLQEFPEIYGVNQLDATGKIIRVFPVETNLAALGLVTQNLEFLKASLARGDKFWFSPPFPLFQGQQGFVCYLPLKRREQHVGWLAVVISTDRFFDFFTGNEFGKNFYVEVKDLQTGTNYVAADMASQDYRGGVLFENTLQQFGRELKITVWPKDNISPPPYPWLLPLLVSLLFSALATLAYNWWLQRESAHRALAKLNQLLSLTIHDTATNLATVRGYLQVMQSDPTIFPVEKLSRHVGLVTDLLDQMKLVGELSYKGDSWKKEPQPLLPLVTTASETVTDRLSAKKLFLRYDPEELAPVKLTINSGLFTHGVLANIFIHAALLAPAGSTISVSYHMTDRWHEIEIQHQGAGVPDGFLKKLSEDSPSSWGEHLVLMIAQRVIELHEGEILVQNNKVVVKIAG